MVEVLTSLAFATGGVALGLLVEVPLYNKVNETREKYKELINKLYR